MIKNREPITLAEARDICKSKEENEKAKQICEHIKQFVKIKTDEALKLKQEIQNLGIVKMKALHIVKIINLMPGDAEDIRKIFVDDITLNQDEITKILEAVSKYRK